MRQTIETKAYFMPFSRNGDRRAVFVNENAQDLFFANSTPIFEYTGNVDFDPRQTSFVFKTSTADGAYNLQGANYLRVKVFNGTRHVATYCYYVNSVDVLPVYELDNATENNFSAVAEIELDPWGTYVTPKTNVRIPAGAVIEQSTAVTKREGSSLSTACVGRADLGVISKTINDLREDGRAVVLSSFLEDNFSGGVGIIGRPNETEANCVHFVGVFTIENSNEVLILHRPISVDALSSGNYLTPSYLLGVQYVGRSSSGFDRGTYKIKSGTVEQIAVSLARAYLIPRKAFQETENYDKNTGYEILSNSGAQLGRDAFAVVREDRATEFVTRINITANAHKDYAGEYLVQDDDICVFADVGTPTTRLELPAPLVGGNGEVKVRFRGSVGSAGYSLVMSVGNRQTDLGSDFELSLVYNAAAANAARTRWSNALNGVSHVGAFAVSAATGNVLGAVGTALSAGQFVADRIERANEPAQIRSQGSGGLTAGVGTGTFSQSFYAAGQLGCVYVRMFFTTPTERGNLNRYGFTWRDGIIENSPLYGDHFFNNGRTSSKKRVYLKSYGGMVFKYSNGAQLPTAQALDDLREILEKGVFIFHNPTSTSDIIEYESA